MTDFPHVDRSLLWVKPIPPEQGGGIEIACDCGGLKQLIIEGAEELTDRREMAFTCDGCQTVSWFTIGPVDAVQ